MARILIVDDDEAFLKMLCATLSHEEYDIVSASNGKDGLARYREQPADLIITDINMPEKSGPELIFEINKEFPGAKIIALSGWVDHAKAYLQDVAALSDVKYTFEKPFNMEELLEAIKEALDDK